MARVEEGVEALHRVYGRGLSWALRDGRTFLFLGNRGIVLWGAAGVFAGSLLLLPMIGTEFIPATDDSFITLSAQGAGGLQPRLHRRQDAAGRGGAARVPRDRDPGDPGRHLRGQELRAPEPAPHRRGKTRAARSRRSRARSASAWRASPASSRRSVSRRGARLDPRAGPGAPEADRGRADGAMAAIPGIADLESSETGENPTVAVRIKRELAADLGITTARIGSALRPLVAGEQVSQWLGPDGQDYDVIVQLPQSAREVSRRSRRSSTSRARGSTPTGCRCWCRCGRWPTSCRPRGRCRSSG